MGWLVGLAFVAVALYFVFKPSAKEAKDKQLLQTLGRRTARMPEVFSGLMKEEYPDFAGYITQAKVGELLEAHSSFWDSHEGRLAYSEKSSLIVQDNEFKDSSSKATYLREMAKRTGDKISPEFRDFALSDTEAYYATLDRIYKASQRSLVAQEGTSFSS